MRITIRTRILSVFIAATLIQALLMAAFFLYHIHQSRDNGIRQQLQNVSEIRYLLLFSLLILLLLLLSALIGWTTSKKIREPLQLLADESSAMLQGKTLHISPPADAELKALANNLNTMNQKLQEANSSLEVEVKRRKSLEKSTIQENFATEKARQTLFEAINRDDIPREPVTDEARPKKLPGIRIFLAEDEFINQRIISAYLEEQGCEVTICGNGQELLDILKHKDADIILMDIRMPVMDGLDATTIIRQREKESGSPPIPIVALTAQATTDFETKCNTAGMNAYLTKPIPLKKLVEIISELVAG